MKNCLALLMTIALISIGFNAMANNGPDVVKLENQKGTITFNHKMHQEKLGDCAKCHTNTPPQKIDVGSMKAGHALCKDCHSKTDKAMGMCGFCHKK